MTSNLKRIKAQRKPDYAPDADRDAEIANYPARRKPVEAWAIVNRYSGYQYSHHSTKPDLRLDEPVRYAHLVERDPRGEAELKSLRRMAKAAKKVTVGLARYGDITRSDQESLTKSVETYHKLMEKKR